MIRQRKESNKKSDGESTQKQSKQSVGIDRDSKQVRSSANSKLDCYIKSRLNLITSLLSIVLILTAFNLGTVYKLNSDGSIDISKLDSILTDEEASLIDKNSTQVRQALLTSDKPRVWIIGRNMESGYLRHVIESFDRIGYQRVDGFNQEWDVLWSHDYPFGKEFFTSLRPHQKVNHFPGSGYITNKVSLATTSMDHIPKAFHLPKEKDKFVEYAKNNPDRLWVKKSNNHRGIRIEKIDEINLDDSGHFVQEYIQNPLLIDGKKFDIGLYVIQTSINPLRVYIYDKDALLRWCGNKYHPFNASDFQSYVVGDDYTPIWEMPSLSKYFTELNYNMKQTLNIYLKSIGKDPEKMWNRIEEAITNVYKEKDASMARLSSMTFPKSNRNFFEMVRFDFLVDEDLNVYLMEANMSPNLSSAHFAPNKLLYEQVIYNLFSLVGLTRLDGLKDWPQYESDSWNLRVSDKDLAVNEELCTSEECFMSCRSEVCRTCYMCLSDSLKLNLKDAYLEHSSKWNSKRLIPSTKNNSVNPTDTINQIQADWFKGKCAINKEWCT